MRDEPQEQTRKHKRDQNQNGRNGDGRSEIGFQRLIDRQRHGLRAPDETARKQNRRAEFAQRARPTQNRAGQQRRSGQRQRHAPKDLPVVGAQIAGAFFQMECDTPAKPVCAERM